MIEIIEKTKHKPRIRRSKNNDAFHEEIPRLEGKPFYKKNKNAQIEYINMVRRLEEKDLIKEKYDVKSKTL